jgi:predicted XRE-type DNA-binding protein
MKPYIEVKNLKELCKSLGLPEAHAPKFEMRRDLVIAIKEVIEKKALTHVKAAGKAGVGRTVITSIVNGNIAKISTDKLIDVATSLGVKLRLKVAA